MKFEWKKATVAAALMGVAWMPAVAGAQDNPAFECDNQFGDCGTPNMSGGGGGGGGGSILINNTDLGDTYQFADDYDDDGIEDTSDNCPRIENPDQADSDGDGVGDACDNCLGASNEDQSDLDGDSLGDVCDADLDDDGVENGADNCASIPNPDQANLDTDAAGDACDDDIDGDGDPNLSDDCPMKADAAGSQDECFPDADGDGAPDVSDVCPTNFDPDQADLDGDGTGDACDADVDGDGFQNLVDNCAQTPNAAQADLDRDKVGDSCDPQYCFVVFGDESNCLDPEGELTAYTPNVSAQTGEFVPLRLFINRKSQPARYAWEVVSAPTGSSYALRQQSGTVTNSDPFEYRYINGEVPFVVPDVAGEYTIRVTVQTVFEDRLSRELGASSSWESTITVTGDDVDVTEVLGEDVETAAGCSSTSNSSPAGGAGALGLTLLGLLGLRRRREAA